MTDDNKKKDKVSDAASLGRFLGWLKKIDEQLYNSLIEVAERLNTKPHMVLVYALRWFFNLSEAENYLRQMTAWEYFKMRRVIIFDILETIRLLGDLHDYWFKTTLSYHDVIQSVLAKNLYLKRTYREREKLYKLLLQSLGKHLDNNEQIVNKIVEVLDKLMTIETNINIQMTKETRNGEEEETTPEARTSSTSTRCTSQLCSQDTERPTTDEG